VRSDSFGFHVSDPTRKPLPVITFSYSSEAEARKVRDLLVEALKHAKDIWRADVLARLAEVCRP